MHFFPPAGGGAFGSSQNGYSMLPQTEAGVPAQNVDPTPEELDAITQLAHVFSWLGTNSDVSTALVNELGGSPKLRDVVYISMADWDELVDGLLVVVPGEGSTTTSRKLKAVERGQVHMARRICRLRLGLTAVEGSSTPGATQGTPPAWNSRHTGRGTFHSTG